MQRESCTSDREELKSDTMNLRLVLGSVDRVMLPCTEEDTSPSQLFPFRSLSKASTPLPFLQKIKKVQFKGHAFFVPNFYPFLNML